MSSSKLSTRGQLVIPLEVRRYLGIHTGDRIDFVIDAKGDVLLRPALVDLRDVGGLLAQPDREPVTVEEMKEAVRSAHEGR